MGNIRGYKDLDVWKKGMEELGYIDRGTNSKLLEEIDHIARMLRNLIKGIKK